MAGWTNKGKAKMLGHALNPGVAAYTPPGAWYCILTNTLPTVDTNIVSDVGELVTANGYTRGGNTVALGAFTMDEDDSADIGGATAPNQTFTASGGDIGPVHYMCLTSDLDDAGAAATGASQNRVIYAWWDIGAIAGITNGQSLVVNAPELRLTE